MHVWNWRECSPLCARTRDGDTLVLNWCFHLYVFAFSAVTRNVHIPCDSNRHVKRYSLWRDLESKRPQISPQQIRAFKIPRSAFWMLLSFWKWCQWHLGKPEMRSVHHYHVTAIETRSKQSPSFVMVSGQPVDLLAGCSGFPVGRESQSEPRKASYSLQLLLQVSQPPSLEKNTRMMESDIIPIQPIEVKQHTSTSIGGKWLK